MYRILLILLAFGLKNHCHSQQIKTHQLDSLFTAMHAQNQFNGSVLIADKGEIILKKGYGYRNEETKKPNDEQTIFELASCSKQFTAAAIVLLQRQGKLKYDDNITQYLPELQFWDKVTIRHLLRHTSGIPEYLSDMGRHWDKTKIATNEDVINYYASRKDTLLFPPGSRHQYCNTNYAFLASIIQRASGMGYASFLHKHIFKPLKMNHTFVYNRRESPRNIRNYATGYVWATGTFNKVTSEHPAYNDSSVYCFDGVVGNAKVNSTITDIYKWVTALKDNTFFTPNEFDTMTQTTLTPEGKKIPYGFGLSVSKGENKFSFGHTGSWDGYMTFIYHNVIKDRTIIILQNFKMGAYSSRNINQILDGQPIEAEYKKMVPQPDSAMERYAGIYTDKDNPEEQHTITCKQGHLIYNTGKVKWDMRFFPVSDTEYQAIRQGGADGMIQFTQLPNGNMQLSMYEYGKAIGTGIK